MKDSKIKSLKNWEELHKEMMKDWRFRLAYWLSYPRFLIDDRKIKRDIKKARKEIKEGKTYTHKEVFGEDSK